MRSCDERKGWMRVVVVAMGQYSGVVRLCRLGGWMCVV